MVNPFKLIIKSKFVLLLAVLKYCCVVKCKELEEVSIFVGRKQEKSKGKLLETS